MSEPVRLVLIYGNVTAAHPSIANTWLPSEEFPIAPHISGMRIWTAISLDGDRLVILAREDLRDKAIDRWKKLRVEVRQDQNRFHLLLKARHVSH